MRQLLGVNYCGENSPHKSPWGFSLTRPSSTRTFLGFITFLHKLPIRYVTPLLGSSGHGLQLDKIRETLSPFSPLGTQSVPVSPLKRISCIFFIFYTVLVAMFNNKFAEVRECKYSPGNDERLLQFENLELKVEDVPVKKGEYLVMK